MEVMMTEKYGFIYLWFDRKHKRYYIGSHWGTEDDSYICSSTWMRNAYRRRPQDFKRRIIKNAIEKYDLYKEEQRWLDFIKKEEIGKRYYNLQVKINLEHWSYKNLKPITTKWKDPAERSRKISETKRKRFQEKRDAGLACFEGQAAENLRIGNTNKKGKPLWSEEQKIEIGKKSKELWKTLEYRNLVVKNATENHWSKDPEKKKITGSKISQSLIERRGTN
jgi:hypothetical protein